MELLLSSNARQVATKKRAIGSSTKGMPFHSKIYLKEKETLNIQNVRALRILIFLFGFSDFSGAFKKIVEGRTYV